MQTLREPEAAWDDWTRRRRSQLVGTIKMTDQEIRLKPVYDLRVDDADTPIRYFIPAYQRGYRWTSTQVKQLLEDIREWTQRDNPQPEEFYCLQPLVLRANDDGAYEVVDGQQRLTTLLLILRHFNERLAIRYQQKLYILEYATRPDLLTFLHNPSDALAAANIDFFHIAQARKTIEEWFAARESEVEQIKTALLNKAKVIWFQLSACENPVAAFTRLNVGKIPLTNGELIRALFLKSAQTESGKALQLRIAYEWDLVEKSLQDPKFWSFLSNSTAQSGGRIDFIFDLAARHQGMKAGSDDYATFNHFSEKLSRKDAEIELEWREVKKIFMLLDEWFEDRRLYHLAGFLIWDRLDVNDLRELAAGSKKREFKETLRAKVVERAFGVAVPDHMDAQALRAWIADRVDRLEYPRDRGRIRSVLLLFNLATLLQHPESNILFQFESFKTARWDIEHVRSVAPDPPRSHPGQVSWLKHCLAYLQFANEAPDLQAEIEVFLTLPPREAIAVFEALYGKLLRQFNEADSGEPDHSIANLVLLDYETNRSYQNAVFAVKRQRVLSLDQHGVFVPLCTRNVFLKCYNPRVDHVMFWTQEDRDGYRQVLIDTLLTFVIGGWIDE